MKLDALSCTANPPIACPREREKQGGCRLLVQCPRGSSIICEIGWIELHPQRTWITLHLCVTSYVFTYEPGSYCAASETTNKNLVPMEDETVF
ncbi:hypothetical protein FKM82_005428 [Ascaphus truei]